MILVSNLSSTQAIVRARALALLARREHSRLELVRKLMARGFELPVIELVLTELAANNWQSEQRFAEAYLHHRSEAGFGPRRIVCELQARGITDFPSLLHDEEAPYWQEKLEYVWHKKYGQATRVIEDNSLKQQRFLLGRGFAPHQVNQLLKRVL